MTVRCGLTYALLVRPAALSFGALVVGHCGRFGVDGCIGWGKCRDGQKWLRVNGGRWWEGGGREVFYGTRTVGFGRATLTLTS